LQGQKFLEYAGYSTNSTISLTPFNFGSLRYAFFFVFILPAGGVVGTATATAAAFLNIFPLIKISTSQTAERKRRNTEE